ncbi:type-F conjugative transfer system protein TraW [Rubrivivax sp. A210]|uniref:type-F conjugative transfer system protein TraW n=1 Tax=Rubrivivax sp. A210 TaxID=2772301 RepID=UPI001F1AFE00|nr:type-F conjugative transfer system protein TraW [Rubrivivax sp. A210]
MTVPNLAGMLVLVAALVPAGCWAHDLGTVGPVYPIAEPDMLDSITGLLREKQASGELARIEAEAKRRVQASVHTPAPVPGLRRVQVARSWRFDPSVRFDESVLDDKGRVVVPGGTVANPLDVVSMRSTWLIFDGRDPAQVALARSELAKAKGLIKPILVGGSPLQLSQDWKRPVYFDQNGRTVKRLGLTAVPVRVSQEGRELLIQELVPQ